MTKICFKCNMEKSISDFYKHPKMADGHLGKCKECTKIDSMSVYMKKTEGKVNRKQKYVADLKHVDKEVRWIVSRIRWEKRNPEKAREAKRKSSEKHPDAATRWRNKNPEKIAAHTKVNNAVRCGKLHKKPCEVCGCEKVHAHHDDYGRPLDVRWLCSKHHGEVHRRRVDIYELA